MTTNSKVHVLVRAITSLMLLPIPISLQLVAMDTSLNEERARLDAFNDTLNPHPSMPNEPTCIDIFCLQGMFVKTLFLMNIFPIRVVCPTCSL